MQRRILNNTVFLIFLCFLLSETLWKSFERKDKKLINKTVVCTFACRIKIKNGYWMNKTLSWCNRDDIDFKVDKSLNSKVNKNYKPHFWNILYLREWLGKSAEIMYFYVHNHMSNRYKSMSSINFEKMSYAFLRKSKSKNPIVLNFNDAVENVSLKYMFLQNFFKSNKWVTRNLLNI